MRNLAIFFTCTLFVFASFSGNLKSQTITDKFGVQHVHQQSAKHTPFYSDSTKEIYLHNYVIYDGWVSNYWHAKIIHAGFNLTDYHNLVDDPSVPGMEFQWGTNESPAANHTTFKNNNSGKDLNWYQGFFIADGFQNPDAWITNDNTTGFMNGDADLNAVDGQGALKWPPNPTNAHSGAVIFRAKADGYIDLIDGFRASYNPGASAYRAIPKQILSVTNNITNIEITIPNHTFVTDDVIFQEHMDGIPAAEGHFKVEKTGDNTYRIKCLDGGYITGPGSYTGSNGRAGLKNAPDNAYFHAYTGDRFSCDNVWNEVTDIDFTNSATIIGEIEDGSANILEPMNSCRQADGNIEDPINVDLDSDAPGGGKALKLSVYNNPHNDSQSNCTVSYDDKDVWTDAGIWSNRYDWVDRNVVCDENNSARYMNNSRYVLKYGKVEFEAKFPALSYSYPQLWLHNDYSVKNLASTSVQYIDHFGPWFVGAWDYEGSDEVHSVAIDNQGINYSEQTTVSFSAAPGSGVTATGKPLIKDNKIIGVDILSPGSGYTSAPSVMFNNVGSGTGAIAFANLGKSTWGGHVLRVHVTNQGIYKNSPPTSVNFTPENGSTNPKLEADLITEEITDPSTTPKTYRVVKIIVKNGGSGYISPPTVNFVGDTEMEVVTPAQATAVVSDRGEDEVYHYLIGTSAGPDYAPYLDIHKGIWACFKQIPNNLNNRSFSHAFRNYTAEWLPGELRFLVDGAEIARFTRCIPSKPLGIRAQNFLGRGGARIGFGVRSENGEDNDMFIKHIKIQEFNQSNSCDIIANKQAQTKKPAVFSERIPMGITIGNINPNPAQDKIAFEIAFTGKNIFDVPIKIELYNVLGTPVMQFFEGIEKDQVSSHSYTTRGLPEGKYYLRVSSGSKSATKSLIIQR